MSPAVTAPHREPDGSAEERWDRRPPGRLALGLVLLVLGAAWLIEVLDIAQIRWETILAATVATIGAVLLLTSRRQQGSDGLIGLGIVLSVVLLLVAAVPAIPITSGAGDRSVRIETLTELASPYDLGAGTLELDLRGLALPSGTTTVEGRVGAGELIVRVPPDAAVEVTATTGAGQLDVFDQSKEGLGPRLVTTSPGGGGSLVLDLQVGLGQIEVTR